MKLEFDEVPSGFLTVLSYQEQKTSIEINEGVSGGVNGGVSGGVSGGVNKPLELVVLHPNKRVAFFESEMNVPTRTIERWLKILRNENKVKYEGSAKNGGYVAITHYEVTAVHFE